MPLCCRCDVAMNETPFFFPNGACELFGVLHRPESAATGCGFVFCHPFAEEKLWAHRVYVSLARDLAARGHAVLRFDHMGHGDSDGEFVAASVETHLSDISAAVERLRESVAGLNRINLFGLRLGATFAALAATRREDIDRLVLWEPVVEGGRYMQEVLRGNLTSQMAAYGRVLQDRKALVESLQAGKPINVDGYELGLAFYEQASSIDLLARAGSFSGQVLILQAGKPGQPPRKELVSLAEGYPDAHLEALVEEPFWREIKPFYQRAEALSAATLSWLDAPCDVREQAHG
ncbi:conserved hypothetical protein [Thioalkalivibrio sulfidiphilus HL-EbGr7]|uniref:Serine aminopeptidase S33 domain-containing protein n=2 Tax=Thioalkalivibrio TaxID=106633 RepID=B8GV99_THISH|nr:conserved hypothetical protein [Thioalkalivibrio sulfidiphilus HL-EbGr7]